MYKAKVSITLRKSILDPKGKAAHHALQNLGMHEIENVRIGKLIELSINARDENEAKKITDNACKQLLANEVMEDYEIEILKTDK
ncbi:MAG TPA: phosphoribosylformylglycinamidine synthase subunit PurS [Balneolaceae bacterium]|nr:phosphoribosylformylglycinamidine synthase subunit PurS [Balneolaceae bacterium]